MIEGKTVVEVGSASKSSLAIHPLRVYRRVAVAEDDTAARARRAIAQPALRARSSRVVVIERDAGMGDWLLDELRRAGFQVALATTGHAGIGLIRSVWAEAVVADMQQDDLPGLDLLRELHGSGVMPKVILTTSVVSGRQAARAFGLGASAILERPFSMDRLLTLMSGLLED